MKSRLFLFAGAALFAAGCSTAQRERSEQRDKVSVSSGYYCGFINGDEFHDVEVQLNLELAKRCDSNKSSTITNYKNSAELFGIVYCCTLKKDEPVASRRSEQHSSAPPKAELHDSTAPKADAKPSAPPALAKPAAAAASPKPGSPAPAKAANPPSSSAPKADKDDDSIAD